SDVCSSDLRLPWGLQPYDQCSGCPTVLGRTNRTMSGVHTRKASVRCKACGRSHRPMEAHMKKRTARLVAASIAVVLVALGAHALSAQPAAFKRTVLRKADLSTPGRAVVPALVELPVGVAPGKQ